MPRQPLGMVLRHLRQFLGGEPADCTDRQLLERFTSQQDDSAFAALVTRHGPMVHRVCRRLLDDPHDADDAFQATFLVLVRKAPVLPWRDAVGSWLHQVAYRVSLKARANRARRRLVEKGWDMSSGDQGAATVAEACPRDLRQVLDEELQRLPTKYRAPLVLCYLEGKTHDQAAQELGWKRGSMAYRVDRGLELLRDRLTGRGVALSAGLGGVLAAGNPASAAVPAVLLEATLQAATLFAAGEAVGAGGVPVQVTTLADGVLKSMFISKLKTLAIVGLGIALIGGGLGWLWPTSQGTSQAAVPPGFFGPTKPPVESAQLKADRAALVKGNTQFALDLYQRLRGKDGNLFLSPYGISAALAMTSGGARGQTLEQMTQVLHLPAEQPRLHAAFAALLWELQAGGKPKGYQLHVANALWGQRNYGFHKEFLADSQAHYGAGLHEVDYVADAEKARQTINSWVEKETENKIKDLIKPGVLEPRTRLVLTNAIYFKGDWNVKFKKENTREEPFLGTSRNITAPLMHQRGEFKYLKGADFRALELPYAGQALSMVVFLPEKPDGLADFEKSLTEPKLAEWLSQMRPVELPVWLPKFQLTEEFKLGSELSALGMPAAFQRGADFSGMNGGAEELFISAVVHKAFVDVNEEGTEAAAATGVLIAKAAAVRPDPPRFRADHPFVFLIRDNRSGSVLFLGRLVNPK